MEDRYLTTAELAIEFRTSPDTVRYWRHIGYGPQGRKVGRRVLYERAEVEEFWRSLEDPKSPLGDPQPRRGTRHGDATQLR